MKILCRVVTPAYMVSIDIPCEDNILSERIFFFCTIFVTIGSKTG
jgi:hypothetical protein